LLNTPLRVVMSILTTRQLEGRPSWRPVSLKGIRQDGLSQAHELSGRAVSLKVSRHDNLLSEGDGPS